FEDGESATVDEIGVDPYTGEILGGRLWGDISQGWTNVMPFLLLLHYQLAIGTVGTLAFGIIALLWTLDCFVGAYLTFPGRRRAHDENATARRGFGSRWLPAWRVRWKGGAYKLNFDLHRASGLWFWAVLFVFAWSSVGMNLAPIYNPVMNLFFEHQSVLDARDSGRASGEIMDWPAALATGERLIARAAREEGFAVIRPDRIGFNPEARIFQYSVRSDRDMVLDWGGTTVYFDAVTGEALGLYLPSGKAAGDTVTNWLYALHFGAAWGWWFRVFITVMGVAVAVLSVTGVVIWFRKRRARGFRRVAPSAASRVHLP
ncbi:MAG TPA: PepSY-associated TM helix domain-containing protein, partial [Gammaproteobacteria bacterium]